MLRAAATVLALLLAACHRNATLADAPAELPAVLAPGFTVDAPEAAAQMTYGFFALEGTWRWAAPRFGVVLGPAAGAGRLELAFTVPEPVADKLLPLEISATVQGVALAPESVTRGGEHRYVRDLPPGVPIGSPLVVEFASSRSIPPEGAERRELAVAVTSVRLVP